MTWSGIAYFGEHEFRCPCCGAVSMDPHVVRCLDMARGMAGVPFEINSGFRCAAHNRAVGGRRKSAHLDGYAADIRAASSEARFKILHALLRIGFRRIGVYPTFIHADMAPGRPSGVVWID